MYALHPTAGTGHVKTHHGLSGHFQRLKNVGGKSYAHLISALPGGAAPPNLLLLRC